MESAEPSSVSLPRVSLDILHDVLDDDKQCELEITVHNDNADTSLTVLTWNTPLDKMAVVLGVFEINDLETGKAVEMDRIMASRMLPPPPEDIVEIKPKDSTRVRLTVTGPTFTAGHRYSIRAKGWWQTIWHMSKEEVVAKYLKDQSGATAGDFLSNTVEFKKT